MLRNLTILSLALSFSLQSIGQSDPPDRYYVVIGAFRVKENAEKQSASATHDAWVARLSLQPQKNLHYVYLLETEVRQEAVNLLVKVKAQTSYQDAWIYQGLLGATDATVPVSPAPEEQPSVEEVKAQPELPQPVSNEKNEPVVEVPVATESRPESKPDSTVAAESKPKPAGKPFLFRMVSEVSGNPIIGEIHVVENAKANQEMVFKANEVVYVPAPKNRNGTYQVVTFAPGYKEMKRTINYANPGASASEIGPEQEAVIALPLVRVKVGDYIEFASVRFFPNTAILQPESQSELDGLVQLLKENEKYKIKIHGHVNGEGNRDIVSKGSSPEFFTPTTSNLKENVTATRLSQLRADIVKEYLVVNGIDESRIQTKGEGGKQLLFPRNSTLSSRNDRVEVEIKKGK